MAGTMRGKITDELDSDGSFLLSSYFLKSHCFQKQRQKMTFGV
jgi:hypothetical protein